MSSSKWNARPSYTVKPLLGSQLSKTSAVQSAAIYTSVALVAAVASCYGVPLLSWLHIPHITAIGVSLSLVAVLGALGALNTFSRWRDSNARAKAQAALGPRQRELLGLPPMPPPQPGSVAPEAAPAAARAATLLATPISPAQRLAPLTPSSVMGDVAPRQLAATAGGTPGSAGRSSWTASPGTRLSPWSAGPAVATPDQVKGYINAFTRNGTHPGAAAEAAAAGASPMPVAQLYYGDQGAQGPTGSPALPIGRDAPAYRPSLLPRKAGTGASAVAAEGLQPSAAAEAGRVMREVLQIEAPQMLVWIERMREWFALQLLGPLAHLMLTAHEDPNSMLAALAPNQQAPKLLPIAYLLGVDTGDEQQQQQSASGPSSGLGASFGATLTQSVLNPVLGAFGGGFAGALAAAGRGGQGAGGGGGGGGSSGVQSGASAAEDARNQAQGLMDLIRRSQLPYGFDPQPLLMALHRYSELLLLLSGRRPSELLPPTPPSYIANRVWQLAQGTCVKAFNWGGGGDHAGQSWTPDLPSDSGLLFYLFAAFLDAPGWTFSPPGAGGPDSSRGAPLYLGSLRSNRPVAYSALLAFRPDKPGPGAVAVIASNLASRKPRFSLLLCGQLITLSERDGLFKVLLMWLQYHLVERQGLVGGRYLNEAALGGLEDVMSPVDARPTVPQRVFNWWYPPNK